MNTDVIKGRWTQLKGHVRERWGKLTDDDIDQIAGQKDQLVGKLQAAYGRTRESIEQEVDEWSRKHEGDD